jgi:hypothetical protein
MGNQVNSFLRYTLGGVVIIAASFLGYLFPWLNVLLFWLIVVLACVLAWRSLFALCTLVLLELVLGGKGYLFSFAAGDTVFSIRQALFIIVIVGFLIAVVRERRLVFFHTPYFRWSLPFFLLLGLGLVLGWFRHPHDLWFHDSNGYFAFALFLPFSQAFRSRERLSLLVRRLAPAVTALALFTILLSGIFSTVYYHPGFLKATAISDDQRAKLALDGDADQARVGQSTSITPDVLRVDWSDVSDERPLVYRWVRDTGTAEIAYLGQRVFRVFTGSHIFLAVGLVWCFAFASRIERPWKSRKAWAFWSLFCVLAVAFLLSFSRSLWLGAGVGILAVLFFNGRRALIRGLATVGVLAIVGAGAIMIVAPRSLEIIQERFQATSASTSEIAASNRLQLLPEVLKTIRNHPYIGNGFGLSVTYQSLIAGTTDVEYVRVYMFEWAYLDLISKIGLIGLGAFFLLLGRIVAIQRLALRRNDDSARTHILGALAAVIIVMVAHIFTPYLNHPLGISLLAVSATSVLPFLK